MRLTYCSSTVRVYVHNVLAARIYNLHCITMIVISIGSDIGSVVRMCLFAGVCRLCMWLSCYELCKLLSLRCFTKCGAFLEITLYLHSEYGSIILGINILCSVI